MSVTEDDIKWPDKKELYDGLKSYWEKNKSNQEDFPLGFTTIPIGNFLLAYNPNSNMSRLSDIFGILDKHNQSHYFNISESSEIEITLQTEEVCAIVASRVMDEIDKFKDELHNASVYFD